jgi:hypothetical protein
MNAKSRVPLLASGVLLIVGGLVSAVGASVFRFGPSTTGSWLTVVGVLLEAAAFIAFAVGLGQTAGTSAGRRTLMASGILGLIFVAFFAFSESTNQGWSIPSLVSESLEVLLLLVAAIAIRASSAVVGPLSWALLPAAIWDVIDLVLFLTGIGGQWFTVVFAGIFYIVAGIAICVGVGRGVVASAFGGSFPFPDDHSASSAPESL